MEISRASLVLALFGLCVFAASANDGRKTYIVYMGELPRYTAGVALMDIHHTLLTHAIGDERIARESKIHSYGKSINAFAARLLPHEASRLSERRGVISVFPSTVRKLHTTRSWDFLGLPEKVKRNHNAESNLIVGLLDTGIWPSSPSFQDSGYGPPPNKWKGKCEKIANFTGCNNKLIGAKYINLDNAASPTDDLSPVDTQGHGTHTSSTAAGATVKGASLYGFAKGTARGGVPSARIAMYKVCWGIGCSDADLLAGFDEAIADGVDIISVSIGGFAKNYFEDVIAIGAFHAMKKGILTSCSAGNSGPYLSTVENVAPWIFTVAASSLDRQFKTTVKLGNGKHATGRSINTFSLKKQMYPLTSGLLAGSSNASTYGYPSECDWGTLLANKVMGKIVYCVGLIGGQDYTVKDLGGVGTIMSTDSSDSDAAFTFLNPATVVSREDGTMIDKYINSTRAARAIIYKSRVTKTAAPLIASFSSRGPQTISINILKPDIAAPGLSILAAYTELSSITGDPMDKRISKFNIISGTSMACPHVSGAAAYVKSFHPEWSPAAIKSALMTTATRIKIKGKDAELGSGAGQIHPRKALDPGLVYDLSEESYIKFLCKEGYNSSTIGLLTGDKKAYDCSKYRPPAQGIDGLNYPSMHIQLPKCSTSISAVFRRTVTNVGDPKSIYKATVKAPKGLNISVVPNTLSFHRLNQRRSFKVVLEGGFLHHDDWLLSAALEWRDGSKHTVRSPIVVYKALNERLQ
ncbi:subtilisin-like protease SBT4.15 [Diospyros lotus]|uniref:subtilisin-like protease SBT4.15 n=1 Tax=Diospyros lotus TaxID=55363 RepID=UPI00225B1C6E|nr:subtilisin-like protease SBT4.15 [Diospyros lotus]